MTSLSVASWVAILSVHLPVVLEGSHALLLGSSLAAVLHLAHEQRQRSDKLYHILVAARVLARLLPVEVLAIPDFFLLLLAHLSRLAVLHIELAALKDHLRLIFCHASSFSIRKAHETQRSLRDDLARADFSKVLEERFELLFGCV